jgi:hypothetical protein
LKESGFFSDENIEEDIEEWIEDIESQLDDENSG